MQNVISSAVKFMIRGLAAALVGLYALGMTAATSTPAGAHGWHCGMVRGHWHPDACRGWGWGPEVEEAAGVDEFAAAAVRWAFGCGGS